MKTKILMMLSAGIVMLAACRGKGNYETDNASADTLKTDSTVNGSLKLVKTAGIAFKVKNVQQSSEKIANLTTTYKGMVMHHRINSTAGRSNEIKLSDDSVMRISSFITYGEMTVRVPSEHLEEYLDSVGRLGIYVNNSSMDIEDRSLDYLSTKLKLNNRRELVNRQKTGKVIIKDPAAMLNLKDDLVDEQIDNRKIDDDVKYSVVNLNFYQSNTILKEVIANDDPTAYQLMFTKQLGLAFANGWSIFKGILILVINCWALIATAAIIWWAFRIYKKKVRSLHHLKIKI